MTLETTCLFSDTCVHCCSLQDTWTFFLRQLCVGRSCPRQAIHQTRSVTSHCRPCGSATSRRHKLRWVLDLPSLPTIDYNRNVSARGCTGRVIRRLPLPALPADGCQLLAHLQRPSKLVWALARLALLEDLWVHRAIVFSFGATTTTCSRALAWSRTTASSKSFFDSCCDHALQLVCLLFIPKFQQALHFRVRNVCDELNESRKPGSQVPKSASARTQV